MSRIEGFIRHLRDGTLWRRLGGERVPPVHFRVRWFGADSADEAVRSLTHWGRQFVSSSQGCWVLVIGSATPLQAQLGQSLQAAGVRHRVMTLAEAASLDVAQTSDLKGILCSETDVAAMTEVARSLARHPVLSPIPFEYAAGLHRERALFARRDEYARTSFVAPSLLDRPGPYAIYEESLTLFEQKCGLRDYLDLYQVIKHVVDSNVEGDLAEFGSYRGHSGWLIARTLQALGSNKRLFMFDTFAEFPAESTGMDHYWNRSHYVKFEEVRSRLAPFPNVTLVRGDFTQTLAQSGVGPLALAYIDCDSYRATRFLIDALWEDHVMQRGVLVCEDYGHPALLGNRAAVHEELDGRSNAFRYFSHFSGFYIALKL